MDFSNERYVRLYVRDTTGWKLLRWEGQCVFSLMYRKADRSGVISLDGLEPWEAAVLHCDLPEDVARAGTERVLKRGWMVHDGDRLVFPRYIAANETPQSDAQRQRESRARRATVTERDAQSQNVTDCHTESRGVTSCHSVPSRADPEKRSHSGETELKPFSDASVSNAGTRATESSTVVDFPQRVDHWREGGRQAEFYADFWKRFEIAKQASPNAGAVSKAAASLVPWLDHVAAMRGMDHPKAREQLLAGFFASPDARKKGYPPAFLATNPLEYFDKPEEVADALTPAQQVQEAERACQRAEALYNRAATPEAKAEADKQWEQATQRLKELKRGNRCTA